MPYNLCQFHGNGYRAYFLFLHMAFYEGQDMKLRVEINANGFDITRDEFEIVLKKGNKEVLVDKSQITNDDGEWRVALAKEQFTELGTGDVYIITYAYIPDSDYAFRDGVRVEVDKKFIAKVTKV